MDEIKVRSLRSTSKSQIKGYVKEHPELKERMKEIEKMPEIKAYFDEVVRERKSYNPERARRQGRAVTRRQFRENVRNDFLGNAYAAAYMAFGNGTEMNWATGMLNAMTEKNYHDMIYRQGFLMDLTVKEIVPDKKES